MKGLKMNLDEPKKQLKVNLPPATHAWLKVESQKQERSLNWIVVKALEEAQREKKAVQK